MNTTWQETDDLGGWEDEMFDDFVQQDTALDEMDELPAVVPGRLMVALSSLPGVGGAPAAADSGVVVFESSAPVPKMSTEGLLAPVPETIDCQELAEAYLEDASRGIAALDQAVIDYESNTDRPNALRQILRELHTLKGASAAVGLMQLSHYIHHVEEALQGSAAIPSDTTSLMLDCLRVLRDQSTKLNEVPCDAKTVETSTSTPALEPLADSGTDSIRVSGAQMDRLLDMVTSLTMLSNQRDAYVDQLRNLNAYVSHCSSRLRDLERTLNQTTSSLSTVRVSSVSTAMREVGSDLDEIGALLRSAYYPIANEHVAVSDFTKQFRQALVSILRMPVTGMFRRLQRAALDAARVEGKQVRLEVVGSESGLERPIQERLLDPLMHIVRNSVSHGIEFPDERVRQGKDPIGVITLEASSSPNLLTLNVRDDGRGLDYDALRKRGTQLGLLTDCYQATEKELGQLIFHPGFSTRDETNEIAGRGIGMDVVADALEKMRAWIDVESVPGQGVTIKLSIPLKSITEHVLVVRIGEHLVALPMQYVRSQPHDVADVPVEMATILGLPTSETANTVLHLAWTSNQLGMGVAGSTTSCLVDEILGAQEVVVRPLPPILRHQPFMSGVTISTSGKVVYVLEPRVIASAASAAKGEQRVPVRAAPASHKKAVQLLVVDDSLSARRAVTLACVDRDWEITEAKDGVEALELMDQKEWTAIITDYDMPRMDGLQLIRAVRERPSLQHVPILMASSRPAHEMKKKATLAGANRYVTKPVSQTIIDEIVLLNSSN